MSSTFYPGGEDPALSESVKRAEQYADLARDWAIKQDLVDNDDYSSKWYAQQAKLEADRAEDAANSIENPSLGSLTDVTLSTPLEGQVIVYRSGEWVNENQSGTGGDQTFGGLLDVTLTDPATGHSLMYVNNEWRNNSNLTFSEQGGIAAASNIGSAATVFSLAADFGLYEENVQGVAINAFGIDTIGLKVTGGAADLVGGYTCTNATNTSANWTFTVDNLFGFNTGSWNANFNNSGFAVTTTDGVGTDHVTLFNADGRLTLATDPVDAMDAVTKQYADANYGGGGGGGDYLPLTGGRIEDGGNAVLEVEWVDQNAGAIMSSFGITAINVQSQGTFMLDGQVIVTEARDLQNITSLTVAGQGNFSNNRVTNVADPVNAQDVVTKAYGDANYSGGAGGDHSTLLNLDADDHPQYQTQQRGDIRYVQLTGGNMTGELTVEYVIGSQGVRMNSFGIDTIAIDSETGYSVANNVVINDSRFIDNITGIDVGNNRVQGVATPSVSTDAASKGYVDTEIAGVSTGEVNAWPDNKFKCAGSYDMATGVNLGTLENCVVTDLGTGRIRVTLSSGSYSSVDNIRALVSVKGSIAPALLNTASETSTSFEIFAWSTSNAAQDVFVTWVVYDQGA
jgi:hypothetical protein